jgi:hypothetical protein
MATKVARLLAGGIPDDDALATEVDGEDGDDDAGRDVELVNSLKAAWEAGDPQAIYDAIVALHDELHKDMV